MTSKAYSYKYRTQRGYRKFVEWIAENDEPTWGRAEIKDIADMMTVSLLSEFFKISPTRVAEDIVLLRLGVR